MIEIDGDLNRRSNCPVGPAGISGPIVRERLGRGTRSASLSVLLPRFGQTAQVKSLYIGSESTYTLKRFRAALARAIALRQEALEAYELEATRARRRAARALSAMMR